MNVQGISVRKSRGESLFLIIASLSALLSVTVISAAPLYFDAIERLGLRRTMERFELSQMGAWMHVDEMTFNSATIKSTVRSAHEAGENLGDIVRSTSAFVRSGSLNLNQINDRFAPPGSTLVYQSVQGIPAPISLVSGAFPSETVTDSEIEVAILASVAAEYGIDVGDVLKLTVPPTTIVHTTPRVAGIFRIDDPNHESWQGLSSTLFDPEQGPTGGRPAIIAYTSNGMMEQVSGRGIADIGQLWIMFYVDVEALKRIGAAEYLDAISRFRADSTKLLPSSSSFSGVESALRTLQRQLTFTNTTTIISGALFAAFAVFVLALNASVIARRWLAEETTLKARGANRNQLFTAIAFYMAILFAIPAIVGPLIASLIVPLLGLLGSFQELTGGQPFPYRILPEQFIWSGILASILFALFSAPVILAKPGPIVRHLTRIRDSRSPWFWRANFDIGIVVAAGAVIFELNGRGSLFVQGDNGSSNLSMLATSLPIIASVAASLVALRLFSLAGAIFERLAHVNIHAMFALALKVFSRSTMSHAALMLLAAGTMIVVINAVGLSATLGKNTRDRIDFSSASDLRISGIDAFKTSNNQTVQAIVALDWVSDHTWGARTEAKTGSSESASTFTMLSLRPNEFIDIAIFRPDYADVPLSRLMNDITSYVSTDSLPLPNEVTELEAVVKLERTGTGRIDIWSRLLDAEDTTHTIRMTNLDLNRSADEWHRVTGTIKPEIPRPVSFIALEIYEPPTSPIGSTATLTIDSLRAKNGSGESMLVSDFADASVWHPMETSLTDDSRLSITDMGGEGSADRRSLVFAMGRGTDDGVRGIYYSESGPISVPLIVNSEFLDRAGLDVGDRLSGQAYGRIVPFEIRGTFDLFPTMTAENQPFAVANVDALLSYLTSVSEPFLSNTAEMFIEIQGSLGHEERIASIKALEPSLRVSDAGALSAESSARLGDAAGWRIVGSLIAASAVALAIVTTSAVTIHNQDLNRLDSALVESLGGSRIGVALEASTRIAISLCLGFALGAVGGLYGVRFIADRMTRTSTGEAALPPMVLHVEWLPVAAAAVLLAGAALTPVVWGRMRPKESVAVRIRATSLA